MGGLPIVLALAWYMRQLPRFKQFARDTGLVDYWREYGWPDLCKPVGEDDFSCE